MNEHDLPTWVLDLLTVVEQYEDEHAAEHNGYGSFCLQGPLEAVPTEVRAYARGYNRMKQQLGNSK